MIQEKRQTVRQRIGRLLYAELGADNGSILLDISEQGCSFQAIAPVRDQQVRFTISVGDGRRVTGDAQVVWVDATGKIGALRFLSDSSELREQIRSWMEITVAPEGTLRAGEQRDSEAKRRRKQLRDEARTQVGPMGPGRSTKLPAGPARPPTAFGGTAPAGPSSITGVQTPDRVVFHTPGRNRTATGPTVLVLGMAALLFTMIAYHQELGRTVMRFGASIAGEPQKLPAPLDPVSQPSVPTKTLPPAGASGESGMSSGIETETVSEKVQLTPVANGPSPIRKPGAATNTNLTEDVPSLWAQVEGGDTSAELALADRYIRGEGVTQSCAQARVLLEAAVKRGSDDARRKLDELSQAGCR
jgi:hypothetical protein